jgi:adenylate kinase family enzyme
MKIALMGCSGSGKSTLARRLEHELGYPRVELDSYFHLPGWKARPAEQFKSEVSEFLRNSERLADGWIVDGNYLSKLDDLVTSKAEVVIWFNLPKAEVMKRVIRRSIKRAITREELWNGNRESIANLFKWDPAKSIIRWSWTQYDSYVEELSEMAKVAEKERKQLWIEIKNEKDLLTAFNYLASINL